MSRLLTHTFSNRFTSYDTKCWSYRSTKNKNASIKPINHVQISMKDVQRKHQERNIIFDETDKTNNSCGIAYKSLSLSRAILKRDQDNIVLPRMDCHKKDTILYSFYNVVDIYPMLENHHYSYNQPLFPTNDEASNQDSSETYLQNNDIQQSPAETSIENPLTTYPDCSAREQTFEGWNNKGKPRSEYLCRAGFFYTGVEDRVRCFTCGLGLKDLVAENDPLMEHVRHSDRCTFLSESLGEERLYRLKTYLCQCDPEYNRKYQCKETQRREIHAPNYENTEDRISSFTRWPLKKYVPALAETGQYYSGYETDVRCFACDGGFRMLKSVDNLWMDHCFFFPTCSYMETKVGQHVINQIKEMVCENDHQHFFKEELLLESSVTDFREISTENRRSLKKQCLEMGFAERNIDAALTELVIKGYRHNIGPLLDVLNLNN